MSTTDSGQTPTPIPAAVRTLSHSQLETYGQCPRRWYLTKVARVPQAPSEHLALGTALHAALEADGRRKLDGHAEGWMLAKLWGVFSDVLQRELAERDPLGLLDDSVRNTLGTRGAAMLRAYTEAVQPSYHPIAVEEELTADVPGTPIAGAIQFTGRLDAITVNEETGGRTIVDFKSAGRPWGLGVEHGKSQATAYLWLDQQRMADEVRAAVGRHKVTFIVLATEAADSGTSYSCVTQVRSTTRSLGAVADYLQDVRITAARMAAIGGAEDAAARTGPLCGWCSCLGHCTPGQSWLKLYGRQPMVPVITAEMAAEMPARGRVVEHATVETEP